MRATGMTHTSGENFRIVNTLTGERFVCTLGWDYFRALKANARVHVAGKIFIRKFLKYHIMIFILEIFLFKKLIEILNTEVNI